MHKWLLATSFYTSVISQITSHRVLPVDFYGHAKTDVRIGLACLFCFSATEPFLLGRFNSAPIEYNVLFQISTGFFLIAARAELFVYTLWNMANYYFHQIFFTHLSLSNGKTHPKIQNYVQIITRKF